MKRCIAGILIMLCASCGGTDDGRNRSAGPAPVGETRDRAQVKIDGEITAIVNGEARKWLITHALDSGRIESRSRWRALSGSSMTVTLFGHVNPTVEQAGEGEIAVRFVVVDSVGAPRLVSKEIEFYPAPAALTWSSDNGGEATITLDRLERVGDDLLVAGAFSGLAPVSGESDRRPGMTHFDVSGGAFQARIRKNR